MASDNGENAGAWNPGLQEVLAYRKAGIAVVATYLGLDDRFVDAVLADEMDEFLQDQVEAREINKESEYDGYIALLSREAMVRYAATAAETLLSSPDDGDGDDGKVETTLGGVDDFNAAVRVHEIFEYIESPDTGSAGEEAERFLLLAKRNLCRYYHTCAFGLVRGPLLPVVVAVAEDVYLNRELSAKRCRELLIAEQNRTG
jgi:hypothetical protein